MAKKKESVAKAAGRFVANELLGVDDAKRAINKARKGDFKGALKSAATGALELGTTATGAGLGAKVGAKVGLKVGKKVADKAAKRAGNYAAMRKAENTPAGSYGKPGSVKKTVKANPKNPVTVRKAPNSVDRRISETVSVSNPKKIKYTTPERTSAQRQGSQKAQDTKRERAIDQAGQDAATASRATSKAPSVGKKVGKATGATTGVAAVASTKKVNKPSPKKKDK
jgi:hypothetical protein